MLSKTIVVNHDLWKKLHELRLRWELKTLSDVIEKLVQEVERNRK
jgi:predicted CopG family antitoxin